MRIAFTLAQLLVAMISSRKLCALWACVLCITWHASGGSVDAHEIQEVIRAWQEREAKVNSWKVTWIDNQTPNPSADSEHDKSTTYSAEIELSVSGRSTPRYMYRRNGMVRAGEKFHLVDFSNVFDGNYVATLKRWDDVNFIEGFIADAPKDLTESIPILNQIEVKPITMCLRPLSKHAGGFHREDLTMSTRSGALGTEKVPIVEQAIIEGEIWVDPKRDYVVVKYLTPRCEIDVDYNLDASGLWLPSGWSIAIFGSSKHKDKVVRWELNPDLNDNEFTIRVPSKSLIVDEREGFKRIVFVDEDQRESELTQAEAMEKYKSSMRKVFPSLMSDSEK